jgi:hypothetical protein
MYYNGYRFGLSIYVLLHNELAECFWESEITGRLPMRQKELLSRKVMELMKRGELNLKAAFRKLK